MEGSRFSSQKEKWKFGGGQVVFLPMLAGGGVAVMSDVQGEGRHPSFSTALTADDGNGTASTLSIIGHAGITLITDAMLGGGGGGPITK